MNGLTKEKVMSLTEEGKTNYIKNKTNKSTFEIVFFNIFTYFNGIFLIISLLLIFIGAIKNLTFLPVIVTNVLIGIFQQLKAQKILDDLALLDVCDYTVIRDGKEEVVSSNDLVLGDLVVLDSGKQIPADGVVVDGEGLVNEALLTGEADEVLKVDGSEVRSGSFIISGKVYVKLTEVGSSSYASKLTSQAKEIKEKKSEMINDIELIIKIAGVLVLPVGLALLYQGVYVNGVDFKSACVSMVAAIIGMIPEGLYLLVTVALVLSAARLAKKKVLLHDMKSIESLARVDILCVDKTGTITSNEMKVVDVFADCNLNDKELDKRKKIVADYAKTITDNNITMNAIRDYFKKGEKFKYNSMVSFSSKAKCSMIEVGELLYRLGAPESILNRDIYDNCYEKINEYISTGKRVLVLVKEKKNEQEVVLFIVLENGIRKNALETFNYLQKQGVVIKVISGDNPITVSNIADKVKIKDSDKYIDMSKLDSYEKIKDAVLKYTVFGRVTPEDKKMIIEAFKEKGLKVAMTGDGVNDILAMKEADCSISMGSGSDAARESSQVVLLDNDFSHMKDIIYEGRRNINNITRSATLFLYKNLFSLLLALFSIIAAFNYPLKPTQVSIISVFNIGIPAFLLAFEPNSKKQEGRFIYQVLIKAIPAALTSFFSVVGMIYFAELFDIEAFEVATASVYLISVVGFYILWNITRPINKYHIMVFVICIFGFIISANFLYNIFDIDDISVKAVALCLVFAIAEMTVIRNLSYFMDLVFSKKKKKVHVS